MASLSIQPERPKVGDTMLIEGSGFTPAAEVKFSVSEGGLTMLLKAGPSGDIKTDKVFIWTPSRVGVFSIKADDGTNVVEETIQIWS